MKAGVSIVAVFTLLQLLAGAVVNDLTVNRQNALHIAAVHDHSAIASVLIENGIDYTALNDDRNNG